MNRARQRSPEQAEDAIGELFAEIRAGKFFILSGLAQDRAFVFSEGKRSWTAEELAEYISKRVRVDPVGETSLCSFSYYHPGDDA
jgi:hypothetical protein